MFPDCLLFGDIKPQQPSKERLLKKGKVGEGEKEQPIHFKGIV